MRKTILAGLIGAAISSGAFAQFTGPSSSTDPYVVKTGPTFSVTSVITVGTPNGVTQVNADNGYKMVGIPDGMGAYDNDKDVFGNLITGTNPLAGTFTLLMNHELGTSAGIARAHGATGAFVSEWVIRKSDYRVLSGNDLATTHLVGGGGAGWAPAAGAANSFGRLCSADLPALGAFWNASTGTGTTNRIFMNGEEVGNEGRAYGFVASGAAKGVAYELPKLGKFSWENSVANPFSGDKTVVIGLDDSTPGQVYVYTGTKTNVGNDVQRAGLDNGALRGIKVNAAAAQGGANGNLEVGQINGNFTTVAVDTTVNGATQQANAVAAKITEFARPEDGSWADSKTFYFVTTGATTVGAQSARLYKISFNEAAGVVDYDNGSVSMVLDSSSLTGTDGATARSFDNITVDGLGRVVIQEDPGNNDYIAKTWIYDPATGTTSQVLESERSRFLTGGTRFLTRDEESSGVIDITDILGKGDGFRYYMGNMQAHYGIAGELVEGGQVYIFAVVPEPGTYALLASGLGFVGFVARRRKARG